MRLYIAYGSNLNIRQMGWRCPEAKAAGTATLRGWELTFKGSKTGSYLTLEPRDGAEAPVALWSVSDADEKALDRYEGFPRFYYKKSLRIRYVDMDGNRRRGTAFVYLMREDRPYGMPSAAYVRTCAEGYRDFGFDIAILRQAVSTTRDRILQESGVTA